MLRSAEKLDNSAKGRYANDGRNQSGWTWSRSETTFKEWNGKASTIGMKGSLGRRERGSCSSKEDAG